MDSDYPFESLGPERFQRLCQLLVAEEFPDSQAFPLRGPDGGRDATAYAWDGEKRSTTIFQVKYVEDPSSISEPRKWLLETMKREAPKVAKLIPSGASSYCLITNIPGTGHRASGSIDGLEETLGKSIQIPFRCWWRDDLVVRMKNGRDLRWEFPELLSGVDVLHEVVEAGLTEERQRRAAAIKAYLTDQYEEDRQVRFKQVDLQNDLLGLFVDIPVSISAARGRAKRSRHEAEVLHSLWMRLNEIDDGLDPSRGWADIADDADAATRLEYPTSDLLLDSEFQEWMPLVVIEGAPGQGKSTIVQYVCQAHRMRMLGLQPERLPERHRACPLRLPFKADLRDLAKWFQGQDPFNPGRPLPDDCPQTVEAFLATSVHQRSGGIAFDVADLLAVLEAGAAVAVFDGLDEVADIETRARLVEELTATARRLRASSRSLQMVVTSRPAPFAKSPGFDPGIFRHLTLESITPEIATTYSEKWVRAKQLNKRDAADVRQVLQRKLREPHMRELAQNTMQLTILLSLIYGRGSSLPDKRTALYTAYIETFLDRESDKSEVVRRHRDLLIDLHGHLAWLLHCQAESGENSGRIGRDELLSELKRYLEKEGHDPTLVDQLFQGVVARVFVLVSRVEGLYEFEVQPLREYFAGRYLYDTAPYSPPGREVEGTLTDRFKALARNPYWLNAARFYAGFFSKGEIPSLVESLKDMAEDPEFATLNQPRLLAGMLLTDWVFNQNPRSLGEVVAIMADPLGVQVKAGDVRSRLRDPRYVLPPGSGRQELVNHCFEQLRRTSNPSYSWGLSNLIKRNGEPTAVRDSWLEATMASNDAARKRWMSLGRPLGAIAKAEETELDRLLGPEPSPDALIAYLAGGCGRYLASDERRLELVVDAILDDRTTFVALDEDQSVLAAFAAAYAFPRHTLFGRAYLTASPSRSFSPELAELESPLLSRCAEMVSISEEQRRGSSDWSDSIAPWNALIERSRQLFGERWAHSALALEASGVRSASETFPEASDLFDATIPLAPRVRYARLRAGNRGWWAEQIDRAAPGGERLLAVSVMFARASARTLAAHIDRLDPILKNLSADEFERLRTACARAASGGPLGADQLPLNDAGEFPDDLCERTLTLLALRASREMRDQLHRRYLRNYRGRRGQLIDLVIEAELAGQGDDVRAWRRAMKMLRRVPGRHPASTRKSSREMPLDVAREICLNPAAYTSELVLRAEKRCASAMEYEPVADVAAREGWFRAHSP